MQPNLGFALLILVFLSGIFLPIFNLFFFKKIKLKNLQEISFALSFTTFICAALSQICLIYSFVISDYSVANVYKNSHHLKPLIYKISGSWGNHEGSMLLLITIISGYNLAFNFLSKIDLERKIIISSCQSFIFGLFAAYTAIASNPFERIFPVPKNGLGLNPILQDIGLAIHPPMLYMGYIGFSLIFSFAIAGLLSEKIDKKFGEFLRPWLFFSWACLTLGIGLGAWWAYRELGWGGYWFWDPVENVSLMPWLAATALIHSVKLLEKKEIFKIWTVFLSILTFIFCLLGIFLVRSGILTSVHSFAIDAKRGFFVIALISIIGGLAFFIFGKKLPKINSENEKIFFSSKIGMILINNYILLIALFIVFLGTTYPIFSRSFFDQFISIGPTYFNSLFSILIIPFLAFLIISTKLNYATNTRTTAIFSKKDFIIFIIALALTSLIFFYETKTEFLQILILFLAILATLITILDGKNLSMKIAHSGFCLAIIGIILTSSFGLVKEINVKEGEAVTIGIYKINFEEVKYFMGENFAARQGDFILSDNHKTLTKLTPQLRYYEVSNQTTNESSIYHGFFGDIYLVIGNKDELENYALRIYFKPFIYLIWLGCILIFVSAFFKIFRARI